MGCAAIQRHSHSTSRAETRVHEREGISNASKEVDTKSEHQLHVNFGPQSVADKGVSKESSTGDSALGGSDVTPGRILSKGGSNKPKNSKQLSHFDGLRLVPRFGADYEARLRERPGAACGICLVGADRLPGGAACTYCENFSCTDAFCKSCFGQYASGKVMDALHFAPPITCPGCRGRVRTVIWENVVQDEVRSRYTANAAALLSFRCPACDDVSSLFQQISSFSDAELVDEERNLFGADEGTLVAAREAWSSFLAGGSASKLFSAVVSGSLPTKKPKFDGQLNRSMQKRVMSATALMEDEERRLAFQLEVLRRYPKIRTPCCRQKMCFRCKVAGWHATMSCEEKQQSLMSGDASIQSCPNCGVPTQRTEGCMQVRCVCGFSWEWQGGDDQADNRNLAPLPLACLMLPLPPAQFDVLLKSLLERRADFAAQATEGWVAAHFAVASLGELDDSHRSDSSRLEALLLHSEKAAVALDTGDVDGDTPLAVAVANGNIEAARFLAGRGAMLVPEVMSSLRGLTESETRFSMHSILAPLVHNSEKNSAAIPRLPLWLEFGSSAQVLEALASGDEVDDDVADAFFWGMWAFGSDNSAIPRSANDMDLVAEALRKTAGPDKWATLCERTATRMLWHALQERWPRCGTDETLLQMALASRADVNKENEYGRYPLDDALERQCGVGVEALLAAGADWNRCAVSCLVRAKELLLPSLAAPIIKCLAAHLQSNSIAVPRWLKLQIGLPQDQAEAQMTINEHMVVAAMKQILLVEPYSATPEDAIRAKLGIEIDARLPFEFQVALRESSTALLFVALHQAYNFERNPDVTVIARLLTFRADLDLFPVGISSTIREYALVPSDGDVGNLSLLMLLAINTYATYEVSRATASLLLASRADPNLPDEEGDTALFWALSKENGAVAEVLIRAGAVLTEPSLSFLQSWVHPATLRPVASALATQLQEVVVGSPDWPAWLRLQFGLLKAESVKDHYDGSDEDEMAIAFLLRPFCGGSETPYATLSAAAWEECFGAERWSELRGNAATRVLQREMQGAIHARHTLDVDFVLELLGMDADPNALVQWRGLNDDEDDDIGSAFDDDDEDDEEEDDDENEDEEDQTSI